MNKMWNPAAGETPLDDISGLKIKLSNPTRHMLDGLESRNIYKAREKYFARRMTSKKAPFDLSWLKKLHREMFGDVWKWAGEFRRSDKSVGVDKRQIVPQLIQLLDDLKAWPQMGMPMIEQAARLHHRAAWIHPFENGNGRWARMLCDIWLRKNGEGYISWPVTDDVVSPIRDEYIAALKQADAMDEKPFIELHRRFWVAKGE